MQGMAISKTAPDLVLVSVGVCSRELHCGLHCIDDQDNHCKQFYLVDMHQQQRGVQCI